MADNSIDFDVNVDSNSISEDVSRLTAQLERAFQNAQSLRNEFRAMGAEMTKDQRAIDLKVASLAEMLSKQMQMDGASRNGGTFRDDAMRNQLVSNMTMSLNTSIEQVQARLTEAATKATERLIKTTSDAIQARLTKLNVQQQSEIATFGNADFVNATLNRNRISAQRVVREYGPYSSLDAKDAASAAEKLAAQQLKQDEANAKYLHGLRQGYFSSEQREQERNAATLFSIQKRTAEQIEAERVAAAKRAEDQMYAGFRRTSALMAKQQKDEEASTKKEGLSSDMAKREEERKAYLNSPQARANAFENRMRIFTDYATIGLSVFAIKNMISTVIDLEDEFKKFQAITQTTDSEMGSFASQLLKVGEASRYSIKDLTETAIVIGQTGLSAESVAKMLPAITNLATASGSSLKEATDVVTAAMGAYNMQSSQASDVADTMTAALNRTKLNMTQLAQGISVSANIARDAGISFNELTAVVASLAQAGVRSGSTIGTGTRQLIQELEAPSDKLKNLLTALGISLKDVDIKSQGLVGVLENLRDKGFGTSEALRALDLRAAAAFSALTGRLDRVKQLQEALLLTSASTEGAAKASESLSATFQRTMNVATELAVNGFGPVVEGLKLFVGGVGELLKGVNTLGIAVPVLTSAMVALGAAFITKQFSQITLGIIELAPAAIKSATAVGALSSALSFLAANPLLVGGVVAAGIVTAILFGTADTFEKKVDRTTAVLNDLQSRQQQLETTISGLDKNADILLNKKEKLNEDPLLRRVTIIEMQKQFADLGGMVSAGATKIDDLIDAMRRLRSEMSAQLPGNFVAQIEQLNKLIDLKKGSVGTAGTLNALPDSLGILRFGGVDQISEALTRRLGGDFKPLLDFLGMQGDGLNPDAARTQGGGFYSQLSRQRMSLQARKDRGEDVSTEMKVIDDLIAALSDKLKKINDLQGDILRRDQMVRDQKVAEMQANPLYGALVSGRDNAFNRLRSGLNDINSDVGVSPNEKEKRFGSLRQGVAQEVAGIDELLRNFEGSMSLAGYGKDDIKNAVAQLKQDLEGIRKGTAAGVAEAHKQVTILNLQRDQKATQAEIAAMQAALNENSSTSDVDVTRKRVEAFLKKERELQIAMIEAKSAQPGVLNDQEKSAVEDINREFDAKINQNNTAMNERMKKIVDRQLAFDQQVLKTREQKLSQDIASMERELARPSTTAERAAELRKKIDEMIEQAKGLVGQQMDIQATRDTRNLPRDYTSNGTATGVISQIIAGAQGANQTGLMRYLIGLENAESTFNPNADNGVAKGLFQFKQSTFNGVGGGDIFAVPDQIRAVLKLIEGDLGAFRNSMGRNANDNELYVMHQQGRGGGLALMDPKNSGRNALDVLRPFYDDPKVAERAITGNGGKLDMTAEQFVAAITNYFNGKAGVADKYLTSADKAAKDRTADQRQKEEAAYEDRKKAARERELKITYDEQAIKEGARKRASEEAIKGDQLLLKKTIDPNEAEKLALSITGSLKGLMDQEIRRYREDPDNRNRSEAQRADDERAIREKYGNRAADLALGNSDNIAKKAVGEQTKAVQQLKDELEQIRLVDGKFSGERALKVEQELRAAERKLEVQSKMEGLQRELMTLQEQEAAMDREGLNSSEGKGRLKDRELQIEKELDVLRKRKAMHDEADRSEGTVGKAISTGSLNFFKQAGMLNAKYEFKSMTEEISDMWKQAMGSMSSGLSKFFVDIFSGTKKASAAFRDLATSILQSMMQIVSQALANQILKAIFGGGIVGGGIGGGGGIFSQIGSFLGLYNGGLVRHADGGGFAASNRDSVHALLAPEEYVIRASAVQAVGRDTLDAINSMGSSRVSKSMSKADGAMSKGGKQAAPQHTNVWVVSPDQVPPPSESDIIATVARDVQNKGSLRTLIKTVAGGG